ncbi:MAG: hypothetical protein KDA73_18950 [Rhodobacteraceae bacterium]|nr:hypothetical protein [Paracoccaceae bacterium]
MARIPHLLSTTLATGTAIAILSFSGTAIAQANGDGRQGPSVFSDAVLDQSLSAMNDFLQARYRNDDMMADLHGGRPAADFEGIARAVAEAPDSGTFGTETAFGPQISGDRSLDVHLAAFHEEQRRPQPLFMRIAAAAGTMDLDFAEAGAVPPSGPGSAFGPAIRNDPTLNASLVALADQMIEQSVREATLFPDNAAISGTSFDDYARSLTLY